MPIKNIKKKNISDQVFKQLLDMITSGQWGQGDKILSENELSDKLGVSRNSVRAATQKLGALGILETRQGEGTFVCNSFDVNAYFSTLIPRLVFNTSDMRDVLEFRQIIEVETARLAAQRATDIEIKQLENIHHQLMNENPENTEHIAELDMQFHMVIAKMAKNSVLSRVFDVIKDLIINNLIVIQGVLGPKLAYKHHPIILDAIKRRNSDSTVLAMKLHIEELISAMCENKEE